jgi:hypothetical protein
MTATMSAMIAIVRVFIEASDGVGSMTRDG